MLGVPWWDCVVRSFDILRGVTSLTELISEVKTALMVMVGSWKVSRWITS